MESVKLNKNFYQIESINLAIKDFKEAAKIKIVEEKDYFIINIDPIENHPFLKEEFVNYVLGINKTKRVE